MKTNKKGVDREEINDNMPSELSLGEKMQVVKNESSEIESNGIDKEIILNFEHELAKQPNAIFGDSDALPLKHSFAPGIYVREIFIPKGSILTGKIHRHSHPNFLMKGEVLIATEFEGKQHLKAPLSIISKAGTKRAIFALEDTVWITVHATNETDLDKIEDYVIAKNYEEFIKEEKMIEVENKIETKNCLILALKKLGRDYKYLLDLKSPDGILLPFKLCVEKLQENKIDLSGISAFHQRHGIWHIVLNTKWASLDKLELTEDDMVGAWVATAVVGTAVVGGVTSYLGSQAQASATQDAAQAQLQATRESIAAQNKNAQKAFDIFNTQTDKARATLQPLVDFGYKNLTNLEGYLNPNSALNNQETSFYKRQLANTLSSRGLTGSGAETSGLTQFLLGQAGNRQNLAQGLAGIGSNAIQSSANLETGLGSIGSNIFSNLGSGIGNTLMQGGQLLGQNMILQGQQQAQGLTGIGNAFQTGAMGLGSYITNKQQTASYNNLLNRLFPAAPSARGAGLGSIGNAGDFAYG